MLLESNRRWIHNAAAAALVGAAVGAAAAVYSLRAATTSAPAAPSPPAAISIAEPSPPPSPEPSPARQPPPTIDSTPIATNGVATHPPDEPPPAKPDEPRRRSPDLPADSPAAMLARARSLADRHDVLGLMALHETVARAAQQRGDVDSPGVKSVLEQVDQRLNEARMWRLKFDAEQFRKAAASR
jgi:hypothetical protein